MKLFRTSILLYLLTIILSSKMCRPDPPPTTTKPLERGYFQLDGFSNDLCNKAFDQQTNLKIEISIYVTDPTTGKPVLWNYPGNTNPSSYTKSDLQTVNLNPNCIFSAVPGDKNFDVNVKIVGDCCPSYGECTTDGQVYWKKAVFVGNRFKNLYVDYNSNGYCIFGVPIFPSNTGENNGEAPCLK